jgi:hypothetical protein
MEEWLLMQGFYHGLTQKAREYLDATVEGSFFVTYSWESRVTYGEDIRKSRLVLRPHSILLSE